MGATPLISGAACVHAVKAATTLLDTLLQNKSNWNTVETLFKWVTTPFWIVTSCSVMSLCCLSVSLLLLLMFSTSPKWRRTLVATSWEWSSTTWTTQPLRYYMPTTICFLWALTSIDLLSSYFTYCYRMVITPYQCRMPFAYLSLCVCVSACVWALKHKHFFSM